MFYGSRFLVAVSFYRHKKPTEGGRAVMVGGVVVGG